jgi:hypothetical protein
MTPKFLGVLTILGFGHFLPMHAQQEWAWVLSFCSSCCYGTSIKCIYFWDITY